MSNFEQNSPYLLDSGVKAYSYLEGSYHIENLEPVTAIFLAYKLTRKIDELYDTYRIPSVSDWESLLWHVGQQREYGHKPRIVGEFRPANANTAVKVDEQFGGGAKLVVNLRNSFEDHPERNGKELIHAGLIAVLSEIELPFNNPELAKLLQ